MRIFQAFFVAIALLLAGSAALIASAQSPATTATSAVTYCPQLSQTIVRGGTGTQVLELQKFLASYYNVPANTITTGFFGPTTQNYVKKFQQEQGLNAAGIAGGLTRAAIAKICSGTTPPTDKPGCPMYMTVACLDGAQSLSSGNDANGCPLPPTCGPIRPVSSCKFNDQVIVSGASVTAYRGGSDGMGATCTSEVRTCTNGVLSGSYTQATCANLYVKPPICPMYLLAPCTDGTLVPQGKDANGCELPPQCIPKPYSDSCIFNNKVIAGGASVTAFREATISAGQSCQSEVRTCRGGVLSGSFTASSCTTAPNCRVYPALACPDGSPSIQTGFDAAGCALPPSCQPVKPICPMYPTPICTDGVLVGQGAVSVDGCQLPPRCVPISSTASCSFNNQSVASGKTVIAYKSAVVGADQSCVSEVRTCTNGVLTGSYTSASCTKESSVCPYYMPPVCTNGTLVTQRDSSGCPLQSLCAPYPSTASCKFNDQVVANGASVTAYQSTLTMTGTTCKSEVRSCANGILSGSFTAASCTTAPNCRMYPALACPDGSPSLQIGVDATGCPLPPQCVPTAPPSGSCPFNGKVIPHGGTVTAYQSTMASIGSGCQSEVRTCLNGKLYGSYTASSCTVIKPICPMYSMVCLDGGTLVQQSGLDVNGCPLPPKCGPALSI